MKCSEALKKLKKAGWYEVSQSGSHIKLRHDVHSETIIFPNHGSKELATGTQKAIFKAAHLKP